MKRTVTTLLAALAFTVGVTAAQAPRHCGGVAVRKGGLKRVIIGARDSKHIYTTTLHRLSFAQLAFNLRPCSVA